MPIEKTCEQCSTPFKVKPSHAHQRFCARPCKEANETANGRPAAQKELVFFNCAVCKAQFGYKPAALRQYRKKWSKDPLYCSTGCGGVGRRLPNDARTDTCVQCGKTMGIQRRPGGTINRARSLCSSECRSVFRRLSYQARNSEQEITRRQVKNGYIRLVIPGKDGEASRDIFEHRYVMEQHLGRRLRPKETVHHVDGNRTNNALTNLELFASRHGPGQRVTDLIRIAAETLKAHPDVLRQLGYTFEQISDSDPAKP